MAIALVTGGSRGIGRATALLLAQEGYTVAVNYQQNLHAAQEVMNLITQAGGKAFVLQADISDENQVVAMFTAIDQHDEPLAALVNNAGILFTQCTVENLTAERINRVLSTNVTGYFLCCREAVKRMALKNGGSGGAIVNVSSVGSALTACGQGLFIPKCTPAAASLDASIALSRTSPCSVVDRQKRSRRPLSGY